MRFATFFLLTFLLSSLGARAAIGEPPAGCGYRYGQATKIVRFKLDGVPCENRTYLHGGMEIKVTFWNGQSHREIYVRNRRWHDAEVQQVLNMNSASGILQVVTLSKTRVTWALGDRLWGAYSIHPNNVSFLTIQTGALARAESIRTREEWYYRY